MCKCNGSLDDLWDRSSSGSVLPGAEQYSTRLVAKQGRRYIKVSDDAVIAVAMKLVSRRIILSDPIWNSHAARAYLILRFGRLEHEVFSCLFLDTRRRVVGCVELFRGTTHESKVYPREVVKQSLAHNAAAVILVHNHPSGDTDPSEEDRKITRKLKEALALVDVRVIDHLIVGDSVIESMSDRGLL